MSGFQVEKSDTISQTYILRGIWNVTLKINNIDGVYRYI